MIISSGQIVGLVVVAVVIILALLFLRFESPRINAMFRPTVKTAIFWSIALLGMQTVFIMASG